MMSAMLFSVQASDTIHTTGMNDFIELAKVVNFYIYI